ncbi:MAG TPA: DinB family protein [Puia sp.]|nr:DinB family protein [Puia sp.]
MQETIRELQQIIFGYTVMLESITEDNYSFKPRPEKWSRKEILGHLVDSAQNNIRRFVVGQYEDNPRITYRQDDWVTIAHYQEYPVKDLIDLWVLLNKHICRVLTSMPESLAKRTVDTNATEFHSIEWLAQDYNKHLLHHLHQVLDLEPVAYP